jgi:HD-like signal output (HDOD) protein
MKTPSATAILPRKPTPEQIQAAIGHVESFSPAPRILGRALVLMRDAQCDVDTVAGLIRGDPALAGEIIRIANSAYFSGEQRVQSVEHALQRIGFREAMRLLTLAVSRIVTLGNLSYYSIAAEDFWAESLFNGLFMEELARTTGAAETGDAYTAGLLRYIGRLAINQSIDACGGGVCWLGTETLTQWETDNVGLTHAAAGAMLLRRWKFPEEMVVACEGQERPALLPAPSWLASALFFVSSVIPQDFDQPFAPVLSPIADSDFLHPNGLTVLSVEKTFASACTAYHAIRQSLG